MGKINIEMSKQGRERKMRATKRERDLTFYLL